MTTTATPAELAMARAILAEMEPRLSERMVRSHEASGTGIWHDALRYAQAAEAAVRAGVQPDELERAAFNRLAAAAQDGKISGEDLQTIVNARWVAA